MNRFVLYLLYLFINDIWFQSFKSNVILIFFFIFIDFTILNTGMGALNSMCIIFGKLFLNTNELSSSDILLMFFFITFIVNKFCQEIVEYSLLRTNSDKLHCIMTTES